MLGAARGPPHPAKGRLTCALGRCRKVDGQPGERPGGQTGLRGVGAPRLARPGEKRRAAVGAGSLRRRLTATPSTPAGTTVSAREQEASGPSRAASAARVRAQPRALPPAPPPPPAERAWRRRPGSTARRGERGPDAGRKRPRPWRAAVGRGGVSARAHVARTAGFPDPGGCGVWVVPLGRGR